MKSKKKKKNSGISFYSFHQMYLKSRDATNFLVYPCLVVELTFFDTDYEPTKICSFCTEQLELITNMFAAA